MHSAFACSKTRCFDGALVKGGFLLNSLFLAYFLPALVLGLIAYLGRKSRPAWFLILAGGLSLIGWMIYITGMIRYGFQGAKIDLANWPEDAEMYVISAAWLLTGIALLAMGIKTRRLDIRAASGAIIVLTIFKTFLVDMASLEGVLRAMSFVGLGTGLNCHRTGLSAKYCLINTRQMMRLPESRGRSD